MRYTPIFRNFSRPRGYVGDLDLIGCQYSMREDGVWFVRMTFSGRLLGPAPNMCLYRSAWVRLGEATPILEGYTPTKLCLALMTGKKALLPTPDKEMGLVRCSSSNAWLKILKHYKLI